MRSLVTTLTIATLVTRYFAREIVIIAGVACALAVIALL